jgi:hypothetical protein
MRLPSGAIDQQHWQKKQLRCFSASVTVLSRSVRDKIVQHIDEPPDLGDATGGTTSPAGRGEGFHGSL